jgi:hypothetical protein
MYFKSFSFIHDAHAHLPGNACACTRVPPLASPWQRMCMYTHAPTGISAATHVHVHACPRTSPRQRMCMHTHAPTGISAATHVHVHACPRASPRQRMCMLHACPRASPQQRMCMHMSSHLCTWAKYVYLGSHEYVAALTLQFIM